MTEQELKLATDKHDIMTEYKMRIDRLKDLYSQEEVEEAKTTENDYKLEVDALKAERAAKIAALKA